MRFSELFLAEHQLLYRAVAVLEQMTQRADAGKNTDQHDVHALLLFLHYFVDACHQTKEESILFPALRQAHASVESRPAAAPLPEEIDKLLGEHVDDRFLIERSQIVLFSGKPEKFVEHGRALGRLLSKHAQYEEQHLFPLAEKILNREEADKVAMRMEQADAQFGASQKRLLLDMLDELERKYVPKAA